MTRVLIVEDNLTVLESVAFELEMRDFDVLQAQDGKSAVEVLETSSPLPDIIVSDIAMPDMDGYQLLETIRQRPGWQALPVIFLTAFDSKNAIRIGKELGVDDYLVKPFEPDDLVVAIENKIGRVRNMQEHAAQQLDDSRRELIKMINHELRTPLTVIYGSGEMLSKQLADVPDETTQSMLNLLKAGTERMSRLVNRILYSVQIESGYLAQRLRTHKQSIDIHSVLSEIISNYQSAAHDKGCSILGEFENSQHYVAGIPRFIKAMIEEIVDNAIKFSETDDTITIRTEIEGDGINLIVDDEGCGIPEDMMERIWVEFSQVNRNSQEQQGVGMGLSLAQQIVQLHDGKVEISSVYREGTQVKLWLPRFVQE